MARKSRKSDKVERAAVAAAEIAHDAGMSEDEISRAAVEAAELAYEMEWMAANAR